MRVLLSLFFFFFNDTATTEIYTLSLHDALPILRADAQYQGRAKWGTASQDGNPATGVGNTLQYDSASLDRKSTRLNSSHSQISYAVFCLKKKKRSSAHKTIMSYDHCAYCV